MKILLINGAKAFWASSGKLNATLQQTAKNTLLSLGHEIRECIIDNGYDTSEQVQNFLWMDAVIWQMPGWWMGEPWIVKKYIDDVFSAGYGILYANDGRHSCSATEGYGTGGLLGGRKCMLSLTWNAPIEAFDRADDFFGGVGVDGVYLHFLKANEFIGIAPLPSFICNDVVKNPNVPKFIADYDAHLKRIFG